jgi:hypothetical protein
MSLYIFQIITRQWDKSQLSEQHQAERAGQENRLPLSRENSVFAFDKQCVIDTQGDNVMNTPLELEKIDESLIQIDRFQIDLNTNTLSFIGLDEAELEPSEIGSLDNHFIQCQYQCRQRVYEGGFYYWLYEQRIINAIKVAELNERVFVNNKPSVFILNSVV